LPDALALVETAQQDLWSPKGAGALEYLRGRGLEDETIKTAHLGWTPKVWLPYRDRDGYWRASGVTIPWIDRDRLALVKIRRVDGSQPRYAEVFRDRPRIFPSPQAIRRGCPLIITEGDFDALLLEQELGDLVAVVTLGSASTPPDADILRIFESATAWYLALDADGAGDKAASKWPARVRRVRPPFGKDWTEAHQTGVNLRRWWRDRLRGIEAPALWTWAELLSWRWGPAASPAKSLATTLLAGRHSERS
jgi:hypothetical protein